MTSGLPNRSSAPPLLALRGVIGEFIARFAPVRPELRQKWLESCRALRHCRGRVERRLRRGRNGHE